MSIIVKVFRKGRRQIAELCKGSTADSDSVCEGSNPSPAAKARASYDARAFSFAFHARTQGGNHYGKKRTAAGA